MSNQNVEAVSVVFASDDGYSFFLGAALVSLFENKTGNYPVVVYVIDGGIAPVNKARFRELESKYRFTIRYLVPDDSLFEGLPTGIWPVAAYYRMIVARLLPKDVRKIIYLDCDILILGDLKELYNINLGGKMLGAVRDPIEGERSCVRLGISIGAGYFNSGVLLIDIVEWRKADVEPRLFVVLRKWREKLFFPDNDALNIAFRESWLCIPERFNAFPFSHVSNPLIVHFASAKPWYRLSAVPYRDQYLYYLHKTPWGKHPFRRFMDLSFAQKYHFDFIAWPAWNVLKKMKSLLRRRKA